MIIKEGLDRGYERLVARMVGLGAEPMPVAGFANVTGIGHGGHLFLFLQRKRLILKLPEKRAVDLCAAGLVQSFPSKGDVPTSGWVAISDADWTAWERLADEAHSYAREFSLFG